MSDSFDLDENHVSASLGTSNSYLLPTMNNLSDSNDNISVEETSSKSSDGNFNTDSWVEDLADIKGSEFGNSSSSIKLNISKSACKSSIETFTTFWTDEIFEKLIEFTNNFGENMARNWRLH